MDPKDFVHLHTHSHYSLLEALPKPKALVERIKSQGMTALALTDNGCLYGAVEFYKACKEAGVKPIIGMDAYVAPHRMSDKRARVDDKPHRLPLIVLNGVGYQNLLKISTAGFLDGFYYKPRIDKEFLKGKTEGLLAMTGSTKGEIPVALAMGDREKAKRLVLEYQELFGKENFYLELIHHPDFSEQVEMNTWLRELSQETGAPLIATKNVFYLNPDDKDAYEAQLCIMRGRTLEEHRRTNTEDVDLSMSTPEIICDYFEDVPDALAATKQIADRVNFEMDLGKNYLPIFPMPAGKTDEAYLAELALAGLKKRYCDPLPPEVVERYEYEYEVIKRMGFCSYFIIVQDFVVFAKSSGMLVGPGRGSAAGSIIAYGLQITDLDPLKYGLLFERFLNPDRISLPDVDMDFADTRRAEVLEYVKKKYGEDCVAGIITFGTLKPKAAVRDAARVLGLSFSEADIIAKAIPDPVQGKYEPLKKSITDQPEVAGLYNGNPMAREVLDLAIKLEGNPRHASQHACGIVIGDRPLVERVPLQKGQREEMELITQYSLNSAEAAGLVKMDFLGLSNLTVIQDALEIIEAVRHERVNMDTIPLDDQKTFALLGRGDTTGVFQLESDGMKRYIRHLKPTAFEDIIAMVALYRPGPMQFIESYIDRKHGKEKVRYEHPLMENAFRETYGIPVYQEQVMQVSKDMAGFTGGEADTLRKAMGKKIAELMEKMKVKFIEGAVKKGVKEDVAKAVFQKLEDFAAYGFNKSHAACYAMIAYRTAYLKAHYPPEFMAALMNSDLQTLDRITIEVAECERLGTHVLPPDVNESFAGFAVVPQTGNIRWGLSAIKNFGEEAARAMVRERKANGPYKDFADFVARTESKFFNKKSLESLVKSGTFDRFEDRSLLIGNLEQILLFHRQVRKDKEQNQVSFFDFAPQISEGALPLRKTPTIPRAQLLAWEKELLGLYISSHPAHGFEQALGPHVTPCNKAREMTDGTVVRMAGVTGEPKRIFTKKDQKPMAFVRFEDTTGGLDLVIFPRLYAKIRERLLPETMATIEGKVSIRARGEVQETSILVNTFLPFTEEEIPAVAHMLSQGAVDEAYLKKPEVQEDYSAGLTICVPERPSKEIVEKMRASFRSHPGRSPVFLLVESGGEKKRLSTEYRIEKTPGLLEEIAKILGENSILM
ncbi:MAG: DNA polymerase III subunit alpha [Patescibacteria group bacterium]|jgi:DNA polymerase-3 subunit alpha